MKHNLPTADSLIANAIDFLNAATSDVEARPKHSVIAFYTAVELILKARLMLDHWTLVVTRDPDRNKFQIGDFNSVSFSEACLRLQKVVGSPLPEKTQKTFDRLRKHRNKMVHFYHDGEADGNALEEIALEQLEGWNALNTLIRVQWKEEFAPFGIDLDAIDREFQPHRLYLAAKFKSIEEALAKLAEAGRDIVECQSCGFCAAEKEEIASDIFQTRCHVCRSTRNWLEVACPQCKSILRNEGDDGATCERCGRHYSVEQLASELNHEIITKDNYFDAKTPANCSFCDGYKTVIEWHDENYVCVSCIEYAEELEACGWCNEFNNGDLEMSGIFGCSHCDGNSKLQND